MPWVWHWVWVLAQASESSGPSAHTGCKYALVRAGSSCKVNNTNAAADADADADTGAYGCPDASTTSSERARPLARRSSMQPRARARARASATACCVAGNNVAAADDVTIRSHFADADAAFWLHGKPTCTASIVWCSTRRTRGWVC